MPVTSMSVQALNVEEERMRNGQVIDLAKYRQGMAEDQAELEICTLWDTFERIAAECVEWRDHEGLDRLLGIMGLLRPHIELTR